MDSRPTFPRAWHATDLGTYRPCRFTYETYAYESLPGLNHDRLSGQFDWLGPPGERDEQGAARLVPIAAELAVAGLALPRDFVAFHSDSNYRYALDEVSVTGSWSDIAGPAPSPVEPDARLVRIFSDQQYCACWYLYLRPAGETFLVFDLDAGPYPADTDAEESILLGGRLYWCAGSFEEFAYRYWIENRLWRALHEDQTAELDPDLTDYLNHYMP